MNCNMKMKMTASDKRYDSSYADGRKYDGRSCGSC
jgi:hypothetical protein